MARNEKGKVRFIRKGGRVIPIRSRAPQNETQKRGQALTKSGGNLIAGGALGVLGSAMASKFGSELISKGGPAGRFGSKLAKFGLKAGPIAAGAAFLGIGVSGIGTSLQIKGSKERARATRKRRR